MVSNNIQLSIEMMLGAKEAQSVLGNDPPHHHTPTTSFTCWYQAGWSCAFIYVYTKFWPYPTLLFSSLHTLNSRTHHSLYPYIVLLSTLVLLSAVHFIHKTEDGVLSFYKCSVFRCLHVHSHKCYRLRHVWAFKWCWAGGNSRYL